MYQSTHTGAQVDEAVDKALSADAVPTPGSTNLVESGGVFGVVSNRNLLDNPFFTVNQRGVADATTISGNNYFADRWQSSGNGVQRVAGGGINILGTAYHKLDSPGIAGKMVTLSILYSDGEISSNTFAWTGTQFSKTFKYGTVNIYPSANQINVGAQSVNVTAIKLEIGSVSTLANDAPPNFAEELAKCQYYYQRKESPGSGYNVAMAVSVNAANTVYSVIPLARAMRYVASPTVNVSGGLVAGHSGGAGAVSSPTYTFRLNKSGTELTMNIVSASFATKTTYMLWQNINGYIEISCDP